MDTSPSSSHDRKYHGDRQRSGSPYSRKSLKSGQKSSRLSREDRSPSTCTPPRSRRSNSRDTRSSGRRFRDDRDRNGRGRRDGGFRRKDRKRSRSRHRSRSPKKSKKSSKRHKHSSDSDSVDPGRSTLLGEIERNHGKDVTTSLVAKKRKHKRKRGNSSTSSSSSEEIVPVSRNENNGTASSFPVPPACPPPTSFDNIMPFFPPPTVMPGGVMPMAPPQPFVNPYFSVPPLPPPILPTINQDYLQCPPSSAIPHSFPPPPPQPPQHLDNVPMPMNMMPPSHLRPPAPPGIINELRVNINSTTERTSVGVNMVHTSITQSTRQSVFENMPMPNADQSSRRRRQPNPVIIHRKGTRKIEYSGDDWGTSSYNDYELQEQIGEGTYGMVYKAKHKATGESLALKRVRLENDKEGFPITAVREIKILRQLNHKNIVRLVDIVAEQSDTNILRNSRGKPINFYLVFEYVDHDLMGLLESKDLFQASDIQICSLFKQLVEGLAYCHQAGFLHRDMKCSNILVNNKGELKVADLGLARFWHEDQERPYTNKVITLWYRPPELLLGEEHYGPEIDVWSIGCMLAELFIRKPLFNGSSEINQLELISKICGTPLPERWPDVEKLPLYNSFRPKRIYQRRLKEEFKCTMPDLAIDLLDRMLTLDPKKRISAREALSHPWIRNLNEQKVPPLNLPKDQACHELATKRHKRARSSMGNPQPSSRSYSSQASSTRQQYQPSNNATNSSQERPAIDMKELTWSVRDYLENPSSFRKADELTRRLENASQDEAEAYYSLFIDELTSMRISLSIIDTNRSAKEKIAYIIKYFLETGQSRGQQKVPQPTNCEK